MANELKKAAVLSDLVKYEQPDYLGREAAKVTSAVALEPGTVLQGGPDAAVPWDLSYVEDMYGILISPVPAGSTALSVAVLFAGPASIDPNRLVWDSTASAGDKTDGLGALKRKNFIFAREPVTTEKYPGQIDRVPAV